MLFKTPSWRTRHRYFTITIFPIIKFFRILFIAYPDSGNLPVITTIPKSISLSPKEYSRVLQVSLF
jgi:hypothetical protein